MSPPKDANISGQGCLPGRFPCYLDCCQRTEQFCNDRQQRCQHCKTREMYCGNSTYLPLACDAYCLKQGMVTSNMCTDTSQTVNTGLLITTCFLGAVLVPLLVYEGVRCCRKKPRQRKRHQKAAANTQDGAESPSDALLYNNSESQKPAVGESTEAAGISGHNVNDGLELSTLDRSPTQLPSATQPAAQTGVQADSTPLGSLLQGERLTLPTTAPSSQPPTQADNILTLVKMSGFLVSSNLVSQPLLGNLQPFLTTTSGATGEKMGSVEESYNISGGEQTCRNSRLDNITPSSDTDHVVPIHTGHRGPLSGGIHYICHT